MESFEDLEWDIQVKFSGRFKKTDVDEMHWVGNTMQSDCHYGGVCMLEVCPPTHDLPIKLFRSNACIIQHRVLIVCRHHIT